MTNDERESLIETIFEECKHLRQTKGIEYQRASLDVNSHFKRNEDRLGITKYQSLGDKLLKHIDAITLAIKSDPTSPKTLSEPIESRINDAINYLAFLRALIHEDGKLK